MLDLFEGHKRTLRALRERLARLREGLPEAARDLRLEVQGEDARLAERLTAWALTLRTEEIGAFQARVTDLEARGTAVTALAAEASPLLERETALTLDLARLAELPAHDWLAARSRTRAEQFAAAAAGTGTALATSSARLAALGAQQRQDRRLLDLLGDALLCLTRIRAPERTRPLAEALPGLCGELLDLEPGQGPSRDWLARLQALLMPLRDFQERQKPPQIDEAFELLARLDEWVEKLREGQTGRTLPRTAPNATLDAYANTVRDLSTRYYQLSERWQDHEDLVYTDLLAEARTLEVSLIAEARTQRAALATALERGREVFRQLADPDLSPGLPEEFAALLAQTPEDPHGFQRWRERCRHVLERFKAAMDGEGYRLEPLYEERKAMLRQRFETLGHLPLDDADRTLAAALREDLRAAERSAADAQVPDLIDALERLRTIDTRIENLCQCAERRWQRLLRRRHHLHARAARLGQLALALGEPAGAQLTGLRGTVGETPPDLNTARLGLAQERRTLAAAQADLLARCAKRLAAGLAVLAESRARLDPDLIPADSDLPPPDWLTATGEPRRLGAHEALAQRLPALRSALEAALSEQGARLSAQRAELLTALQAIARWHLSGADRNTYDRVLAALHAHDPAAHPTAALSLRAPLAEGRRLIERVEDAGRAITTQTTDLTRRLAHLQHEYAEVQGHAPALINRIWSLVQPVPGIHCAAAVRRGQLEEAQDLLCSLEDYVHRVAAAQHAECWTLVCDLADAEAQALRNEFTHDRLCFPAYELRRRVRDLALRHRARQS